MATLGALDNLSVFLRNDSGSNITLNGSLVITAGGSVEIWDTVSYGSGISNNFQDAAEDIATLNENLVLADLVWVQNGLDTPIQDAFNTFQEMLWVFVDFGIDVSGFPSLVAAGPSVVCSDPDNAAVIGTDGFIFVPPGLDSSASVDLRWLFASPTAGQVPAINTFQLNNPDTSLITEVYLSKTAYPNRNVSNILNLFKEGDQIYIQQNNSEDIFINVGITGPPVENTDYWTFPVTVEDSQDPFVPNQFCNVLIFHVAGDGGGGGGSSDPFSELTYTSEILTKIETYSDITKTTLLRTKDFTYTGELLTQIVETIAATSATQTTILTYDLNDVLINIERIT